MNHARCLYCYQPLPNGEIDFHPRCSRRFFGQPTPPTLTLTKEQMQELANELVLRSVAVTGVQPKLSLDIEPVPGSPRQQRFTVVGLWGGYILKPPTPDFPCLPENEDLTMHLAQMLKITTADHSLIRLQSGELAYITKRFDRMDKQKLAMEDMCQLTEKLTEDKYRGSMEMVGKVIHRFSSQPGLDAIAFFELTLFCYLTGNADMHLKNFSLLTNNEGEILFSPAYDLLSTKLAMPSDLEEMALTLNGKKKRLQRVDFDSLGERLKINPKAVQSTYVRFTKALNQLNDFVQISFLPEDLKEQYQRLLVERAAIMK